jgi:hypothetical protein
MTKQFSRNRIARVECNNVNVLHYKNIGEGKSLSLLNDVNLKDLKPFGPSVLDEKTLSDFKDILNHCVMITS